MGWLECREWTRSDAHLWNLNLMLRRWGVTVGFTQEKGLKLPPLLVQPQTPSSHLRTWQARTLRKTRYPALHYPWLDYCVAWAKYSTYLGLRFCICKMNMIIERRMSLVNQKDYTCSPSLSKEARQTPLPDHLLALGISRQDL